MAVIPMSYSPATVARRFSILDGVTIQGVLYQIIWDPKTPFAAVIEAAPSVIDGDVRHKVVATLELQRRPRLEGVFVQKFWEEQDVAVAVNLHHIVVEIASLFGIVHNHKQSLFGSPFLETAEYQGCGTAQ